MPNALVLAGNSFVGRYLCHALREAGIAVRATARAPQPGFLPCDLTDHPQVQTLIAHHRPDWIFQCAGASAGQGRPEMDRLHLGATRNLLQAVKQFVPESPVLLFGSAAEYGAVDDKDLPVAEDYPGRPQSDYGKSKLAQLETARELAERDQLRVVVVRPFNLLGPGLPGQYLASALIQKLLALPKDHTHPILTVANSEATRDFVDVRDAVTAVMGIMRDALPRPGELDLYNIASGIEVPVLAVARTLAQLAGPFQVVDEGQQASRSRIMRSCGDASRLRRTLGWQPSISWRQSLQDMWLAAQRTLSRSA
jgi:GDP-4-dehydro-6-deoxy-D-mannose reductase